MKKCSNKKCSKKDQWQPLENFGKSSHTRDGRCGICILCRREKTNVRAVELKRVRKEFDDMFILGGR